MPFTNPILAGLTLIRQAIRSPNYVAGTSGWSINRTGDAEFNNATVRGTLDAGSTVVDPTGMHTDLVGGSWDVNSTGATATSNDGSYVRLGIDALRGSQVAMQPPPLPGTTFNDGAIYAGTWDGTTKAGTWTVLTPQVAGQDSSFILLVGGSVAGQPHVNSEIHSIGGIRFSGGVLTDDNGLPLTAGQSGINLVSFSALSSFTVAVPFPTSFPVGVTPSVTTNIASAGAETARWGSRAISVSNTGFTLFVFKGDAADAAQTWSNVPVHWSATIPAGS